MQITQIPNGLWQVADCHNNIIAHFTTEEDAKLFLAIKSVIQNTESAQKAYYNEPIIKNLARATSLLQALIEEAVEALQELPYRKHWVKQQCIQNIDEKAYHKELCDIQLFLWAIVVWSGLKLPDFVQLVRDKQIYNAKRQDHKN